MAAAGGWGWLERGQGPRPCSLVVLKVHGAQGGKGWPVLRGVQPARWLTVNTLPMPDIARRNMAGAAATEPKLWKGGGKAGAACSSKAHR